MYCTVAPPPLPSLLLGPVQYKSYVSEIRQVLCVVLDRLAKVLQRLIRAPKIPRLYAFPRFPYAMPSHARSPKSFAIARSFVWCSIAFRKPPFE
jgi:hypothetical protein